MTQLAARSSWGCYRHAGGWGYHPVGCKAWSRHRVLEDSQQEALLGTSSPEGGFATASASSRVSKAQQDSENDSQNGYFQSFSPQGEAHLLSASSAGTPRLVGKSPSIAYALFLGQVSLCTSPLRTGFSFPSVP